MMMIARRLNSIVSDAAMSEEGKGLIPSYAGFKADVTTVPGSSERLIMVKLFFHDDPFKTVL